MPFLPRNITSLVGGDTTVSKVNNNLRQAVQPTLDFLNTFLRAAADGSLQFLRNVTTQGNLSVNGTTSLGQVSVTGVLTGSGVFNLASLSVSGSSVLGAVTATSLNTTTGIKSTLDCGSYWNSSFAASTYKQTVKAVVNDNGGAVGQAAFSFKTPYACSLIGVSVTQTGPVSGTNNVQYVKNGTVLTSYSIGTSSGSTINFAKQEPKGLYAFAINDVLSMNVAVGTAGNSQMQVYVTLEMSA